MGVPGLSTHRPVAVPVAVESAISDVARNLRTPESEVSSTLFQIDAAKDLIRRISELPELSGYDDFGKLECVRRAVCASREWFCRHPLDHAAVGFIDVTARVVDALELRIRSSLPDNPPRTECIDPLVKLFDLAPFVHTKGALRAEGA